MTLGALPSSMRSLLAGIVLLLLTVSSAEAQAFVVRPYLQSATPDSMWILWETDAGDESRVDFGETDALGRRATGSVQAAPSGGRVHEVELTGLTPATRYFYRVVTGALRGETHDFVTPALPDAEAPLRLVAMSDMQQDFLRPDVFDEIVHAGIIDFLADDVGEDLAAVLDLVLIPGDLVTNGDFYPQWERTFFTPGEDLFRHVPLYPVPGNHENDSDHFFRYFHLPDNGTAGFEEHWWYADHGNLRVVGLDSNGAYRVSEQLDWLDGVLADACDRETLDFVFAQLHHPFLSELWLAGETDYTGEVVERLERFTTDCGKPSAHLFGHTHGYSRGQSRDHAHLWIDVATAGGNIDHWGEYPQADYDEFTVSEDEYGFVVIEVEAGDAPSFRVRRVSRGDETTTRDNEVRDEIVVRRYGSPPATPVGRAPDDDPVHPSCRTLHGSEFSDPDGDLHGATHWQLSASCDDFGAPIWERWSQHENRYGGEDRAAGDDLTDEDVPELSPGTSYCFRLRYRDVGLSWSEWSEPVPFTTADEGASENRLTNPGAEDEGAGWTVEAGPGETPTGGTCEGTEPRDGERYFAPGGVCAGEAFGRMEQRVDVATEADAIDAGEARAVYGAWLRTFGGDDRPEVSLGFEDEGGAELGRAPALSSLSTTWTRVTGEAAVPAGTRAVVFRMDATRARGSDNDAYFDDLSLSLSLGAAPDCATPPPPAVDAGAPADAGAADAGAVDAGSALDAAGDGMDAGGGSGGDGGRGCAASGPARGAGAVGVWVLAAIARRRSTGRGTRRGRTRPRRSRSGAASPWPPGASGCARSPRRGAP